MLTAAELKMIGGSDAAAIAGISRHKSAVDVWSRIVECTDTEQTRAMRRGQLLEPVVRAMYQDETGAELLGPRTLRSDRYPWARASLDDEARRDGETRVAEFKTANFRMLSAWGDGGDEAPPDYIAQCQWYMAMAALGRCDLAVLLGGDELRIYELHADMECQALLFEAAERFWRDCVLTKRPPPPDGTASYSGFLKKRFSEPRGPIRIADPEAENWARAYRYAKAKREAAEEEEETAKQRLQSICGEADGIEGSDWRLSWRQTKGRSTTDWKSLVAGLGVPKETVDRFTTATPYRVFRLTEGKK